MTADYDIGVAIPDDLAGIVALQNANQPDQGGILSARFTHEWIQAAIADEGIIVVRRDSDVVGYVMSGELSSQAHVPVIQAMLRAFPPPHAVWPSETSRPPVLHMSTRNRLAR